VVHTFYRATVPDQDGFFIRNKISNRSYFDCFAVIILLTTINDCRFTYSQPDFGFDPVPETGIFSAAVKITAKTNVFRKSFKKLKTG
jgi:hypothetical protein